MERFQGKKELDVYFLCRLVYLLCRPCRFVMSSCLFVLSSCVPVALSCLFRGYPKVLTGPWTGLWIWKKNYRVSSSYFSPIFLFSPIFKLKPPIFSIFQLVKPKFVTKLEMELQLYVFQSETYHKASRMLTLMF